MNKMQFIKSIFVLSMLLLMSSGVYSQCPTTSATCGTDHVGGSVWRDYNFNGVRDNLLLGSTPAVNITEYGVEDIEIVAYDADNNIVDCVRTDANGDYVLDIPAGTMVRLDFINIPSWLEASRDSLSGLSTVQFVTSPDCAINLALNDPSDCFPPKDEVQLATPCYVSGSTTAGTSAGVDAFAIWTYDFFGLYGSVFAGSGFQAPPPNETVGADDVGSLWGVAYNKTDQEIYSSAVLRRFMGFGSLGTGGIYTIDPATGNTSPWMTIPNTGIDPRTNLNQPLIGAVVLPPDITTDAYDSLAYTQVGTIGLGDIDISSDDKTLYVMNLNTKSIVMVDVASQSMTNFPVPNPCSSGTNRPWSLEVHEGFVYVGIVCDSDLDAYIYKMPEGGGSFTSVPINGSNSFPLTYPRDTSGTATPIEWLPWDDTHPVGTHGTASVPDDALPQPILSDIEFDVDGSMILGFIDRFGMQMGYKNYSIYPQDLQSDGSNRLYSGVSNGDILRVCYDATTASYNMEGSGGCNDNYTYTDPNDQQGPNGGEYYFDQYSDTSPIDKAVHPETLFGGLENIPGCGEVVVAAMDVNGTYAYTGGVMKLDNLTGAKSSFYELYANVLVGSASVPGGSEGTPAKAAGLGDLEAMGHAVPLEIGNYVWIDSDEDGVQDPGETPVVGIEVTIYDSSGNLIATTNTDANGQYYFDMSDGLLFNTDYFIAIGVNAGTGGVANFDPTNANIDINGTDYYLTINDTGIGASADMNDSDGTINPTANGTLPAGVPYIAITTGGTGHVNHTYDFGLSCPLPIIVQDVIFGCEGTDLEFCFLTNNTEMALTNYGIFTDPAVDTADIYDTPATDYTLHTTTPMDTLCETLTLPTLTGTVPDTSYIYAFFPNSAGTTCETYDSIMVINFPIIDTTACLTDTIMLTVDPTLTNVDWYDASGALVGSGNPFALDATMITGTATLTYTATDANACEVTECCPIIVTFEDCCKEDICLPIVINMQRGTRQ